ncbi:uncharacterized protein LOC105634656 isoform X2 [Jatropha curcas]|nr:uncharacterized protein LOC105634656 isoform X2 [Jatropha curcas]
MAAANNDIEKATTLLKEMVSTDSSEQNGTTNCDGFHQSNEGEDESAFLKKTSDLAADIADLSSVLEDAFRGNHKELEDACAASEQRLSDDAVANLQLILEHLRSLPVEPEWEEHDVYLSQRRNALRMMRLASKHSRAATNAFMRGDHFSAHQLSLKARNEWLDAEGLNAKAAKEILSIRNSEKNPWKLDLHGLHTVEAVQALQERLEKIEIQLNQLVSPSRANTKIETVHSSLEPLSGMGVENLDKQQTEFRQRSASLQVITGVGNHSRGQATLPTAVRSFLTENRYHFDEVKPGVIAVCPKFRHR